VGLDAHAERTLAEVDPEPPLVLALGAEREGLPAEVEERFRIPLREDGPDSLNVAMAATVALYDVAHRMAAHG
jgi:tRNA G18 (ribose-2'-O)-methylase SpoU